MSDDTLPEKEEKHEVQEVVLVEEVDGTHLIGDEGWEDQVIEVEVEPHEVGGYMEVDGGIVQLGEGVDMDDIFPSLLPVRDGQPFFTHNLPELMSREIIFHDNTRGSLCFSKRGRRQLTVEGYLYNIVGYVKEGEWNIWECVNPNCGGSVRTTGGYHDIRARSDHGHHCQPDSIQIRLRIAIYDLRLLCEFTDTPIEVIYDNAVGKLSTDSPDVAQVFPSLDVMRNTLEDHRGNKIYRKRFEMQLLKDKQKQYNMTPEEIVYTDFFTNQARYKRTKAFPDTVCPECEATFGNNPTFPSQDQMVTHMEYDHEKATVIERFQFKDVNLLEQWIRDSNLHSSYKMKRFGLFDEHMYYLCTTDERVTGSKRSNNCSLLHCTSFIRIFDWRLAIKKELTEIVVDYCLDHPCHKETTNNTNGQAASYDYYSPEVFLREIEQRRIRTQKAFEARARRYDPSTFGTYVPKRSLPPPVAAQVGPSGLYKHSYQEPNILRREIDRKDTAPLYRRVSQGNSQPAKNGKNFVANVNEMENMSDTSSNAAVQASRRLKDMITGMGNEVAQPKDSGANLPKTDPKRARQMEQMVDIKGEIEEPEGAYAQANMSRRIHNHYSPPRPRGRPRKTPRVDLSSVGKRSCEDDGEGAGGGSGSFLDPSPSRRGRQRKIPARFLGE